MPTLVWRLRPKSGPSAVGGEYGASGRRGEAVAVAALPDPVISAAARAAPSPTVPGPEVSSSGVAFPAESSEQYADGKNKKKRKINNRAEVATAATKRSKATAEGDLPRGVTKKPSGKFALRLCWGGKTRYIGTFDTPEQASAACVFVKKVLEDAEMSVLGADEADFVFDEARKKAKAAAAAAKKPNATYERNLPTGVWELPSGKFTAYVHWGGKGRHIGTFDTLDKASAACMSVKKDLTGAKLCRTEDVNAAFDSAKKKAVDFDTFDALEKASAARMSVKKVSAAGPDAQATQIPKSSATPSDSDSPASLFSSSCPLRKIAEAFEAVKATTSVKNGDKHMPNK